MRASGGSSSTDGHAGLVIRASVRKRNMARRASVKWRGTWLQVHGIGGLPAGDPSGRTFARGVLSLEAGASMSARGLHTPALHVRRSFRIISSGSIMNTSSASAELLEPPPRTGSTWG